MDKVADRLASKNREKERKIEEMTLPPIWAQSGLGLGKIEYGSYLRRATSDSG